MATLAAVTEDFSTPANGVEITTANSTIDNISGTATGQPTCTTANPLDATNQPKSAQFVTSVSNRICRINFDAPVGYLWVSYYFWLTTAPATSTAIMNAYDGETTKIADIRLTSTGQLQLRDQNTSLWTSTALGTGQWHRVELKVDPADSIGLRLRIYSGANLHSTTVSQDSGLRASTIGVNVSNVRFGLISNETVDYRMTRLRADDANPPAALSTGVNVPPTANAGAAQTNVMPYQTVTLNGSDSSDSDGTVSTYAWTQTGGTTVTLTGSTSSPIRTFTAPATMDGDTLTFSLTVTDNGGATSSASTTTVAVLNHNDWRYNGTILVPFSRQYYNGTALIPA